MYYVFVEAKINKHDNRYKIYRIAGTQQYKLYVNGLYSAKYMNLRDARGAGRAA